MRRLLKVNIEGVMVATGQNLKRLIKESPFSAFVRQPGRQFYEERIPSA
jgi:hypothetical protein